MKCPHCEYVYGELDENGNYVNGNNGDFYELEYPAHRKYNIYPYRQSKSVYACPSCEKLFIN